jgi:hypothetical protein
MPASQFTMWGMLTLMIFGAVIGGVIHGDLFSSLRDAYPSDPAKQEALHHCGQMDGAFSRFSEQDRARCYRTIVPMAASAGSTKP